MQYDQRHKLGNWYDMEDLVYNAPSLQIMPELSLLCDKIGALFAKWHPTLVSRYYKEIGMAFHTTNLFVQDSS